MGQPIEAVLKQLIEREGPGLLGQSGRLKSFLHDECPEAKREISVLLLALDEHVPQDLMRVQSGEPLQSLGPRLAKRLSDEKAMDRNASEWAVRTWARGLGFATGDEPGAGLDALGGVAMTGTSAANAAHFSTPSSGGVAGTAGAAGAAAAATARAATAATADGGLVPKSRNAMMAGLAALALAVGAWFYLQPSLKVMSVSTAEAIVGDGKRRDVVVEFKTSKSPVQKVEVRHVKGESAGNPESFTATIPADASNAGRANVGQIAVRTTKPSTATFEYVLVAADGKRSEPFEQTFDIQPAPVQPATITSVDVRRPQFVGRPFAATIGYQAGSSDVAQIELKVVDSSGKWSQNVYTQSAAGTAGKASGTVQYAFAPAAAPMRATVDIVLVSADGGRSEPKRLSLDVQPQTPGMLAGLPTGIVQSVQDGGPGEASGAGAVVGGVLGGVLGHQVGGGRGQTVATVGGAVGGALLGNQAEKSMSRKYNVTVRLDDGRTQVYTSRSAPTVHNGDRVKIVNGNVVLDR